MSENVRFCPTPPPSGLPALPPPSPVDLSPRQRTAISLLCAGRNLAQTAHLLGLNPRTLHRWRTNNPFFIAELHRRQRDLHDTAANRLRLTLLRCMKIVDTQLRSARYQSDRVSCALALLKTLDVSTLLTPPDSLTADQVLDDMIRQQRASTQTDPTLPITDADRDAFLAALQQQDESDPPTATPTPPPTRRIIARDLDTPPLPPAAPSGT